MRYLASAALSFAAAIFAANYILKLAWLAPCAILCALFGLLLLLMRRKWLKSFALCFLFAALGLVWYKLHFDSTMGRVQSYDGQAVTITCRALEYPSGDEEFAYLEAKVLDGEASGSKAKVYDYEGRLLGIEPGDVFSFSGKVLPADTRYGKEEKSYTAEGCYLLCSVRSEVSLIERGGRFACLPARISRALTSAVDSVFPRDTAAFAKSLMLGDKSDLYANDALYVDMSRAGLMHIVAVSGMHVAFLVAFLQLVLGATPRSSLLGLVLTWLFVLVTGAGPAAVRAGIMETIVLFAPIVRRENDPITAMSAALAIILAINPFAAASVSLQLSFSAFAGILCFSDRIYKAMMSAVSERIGRSRWYIYLAGAVSSSVGAVIFSTPLAAVYFGYVAIFSMITNVLSLWVVSLAFGACYFAAVAGLIWPAIGPICAAVASLPLRYIMLITHMVGKIPFALIYMSSIAAILWLVLVYAVVVFAVTLNGKSSVKIALALGISAASLAGMLLFQREYYRRGDGYVAVLDVGQGQSIVSFAGDATLMIDCGGKSSMENAGNTAGAYLNSHGRRRVDVLILTHLHEDHANGVVRLMDSIEVETLILPKDGSADNRMMEQVIGKAEEQGIQVIYLEQDALLELEDISVRLFAPAEAGGENERCIMGVLSIGEYDVVVTGDAPTAAERELIKYNDLGDAELLIVGHHGSKYSCCEELLQAAKAETAVISVGYNSYGHPTEETLERIEKYGYNIFRTDMDGAFEVCIDDG